MALGDVTYGGQNLSASNRPYNWVKQELVSRDFTTQWLDLDEVKEHLLLFGDSTQDAYVESLMLVAKNKIEDIIGGAIGTQIWRTYYPASVLIGDVILLNLPQANNFLVTVNTVSYYNNAQPATQVVLDPSSYQYDPTGNSLLVYSIPSSSVNNFLVAPVIVQYSLAPLAAVNYPAVKHAAKLLIGHWYNQRAAASEVSLRKIAWGVDNLLTNYKPLVT